MHAVFREDVSKVLEYYGVRFLDRCRRYYRDRYIQAKQRGYDVEGNKYFWIYKELRERLLVMCQAARFLEALPNFMTGTADEQVFQYVTTYVNGLFQPELTGYVKRDPDDTHPFFNSVNPYWQQMNEVLDGMGDGYNTGNLPLLYVDLCEYVVRALRLLFQMRELTISAIDRDKFDLVMELDGVVDVLMP